MPGVSAFGDWAKVSGLLRKGAGVAAWRKASDKAILKQAHRIRRLMVQAFNKGGPEGSPWPKLSEMTLLLRKAQGFKGTKPMMRTGDLRNSVSVVKEGEGVFVGFHRDTKASDGKPAHAIMEIHEFGTVIAIPVTDNVRGFFSAMSEKTGGTIRPLGPDKTIILVKIPPRPVVGPIWQAEAEESANNIVRDTLRGIGWGEFASLIG